MMLYYLQQGTLSLMLTFMFSKKHKLEGLEVNQPIGPQKRTRSARKGGKPMKKLLALALSLCLLLGMASFASAADTTTLTMWTFIARSLILSASSAVSHISSGTGRHFAPVQV